jgi:hypothetical protein
MLQPACALRLASHRVIAGTESKFCNGNEQNRLFTFLIKKNSILNFGAFEVFETPSFVRLPLGSRNLVVCLTPRGKAHADPVLPDQVTQSQSLQTDLTAAWPEPLAHSAGPCSD